MSDNNSGAILDAALHLLSELAPDETAPDPTHLVIYGNGSVLESIILVNLILGLEEELSLRLGLTIDLVEVLNDFNDSLTLGAFCREIEARIAKV